MKREEREIENRIRISKMRGLNQNSTNALIESFFDRMLASKGDFYFTQWKDIEEMSLPTIDNLGIPVDASVHDIYIRLRDIAHFYKDSALEYIPIQSKEEYNRLKKHLFSLDYITQVYLHSFYFWVMRLHKNDISNANALRDYLMKFNH